MGEEDVGHAIVEATRPLLCQIRLGERERLNELDVGHAIVEATLPLRPII